MEHLRKPHFIKRKRSKTPEPKQTRQKVRNSVSRPVWRLNLPESSTGSEIFRGSVEFRGFFRIFGYLWDQCKSEEKPEESEGWGGGILRNYMAHRSRSHIKICRIRSEIVCQSFQNCRFIRYSFDLRETWQFSSCFWPTFVRHTNFQPLFRLSVSLPEAWALLG